MLPGGLMITDIPKIITIAKPQTKIAQEYDDNNYFDVVRLDSIFDIQLEEFGDYVVDYLVRSLVEELDKFKLSNALDFTTDGDKKVAKRSKVDFIRNIFEDNSKDYKSYPELLDIFEKVIENDIDHNYFLEMLENLNLG